MRNVGQAATDASKAAVTGADKASVATKNWGSAAARVGTGLGLLMAAAIKLANESEVAQTTLQQSIENTGADYDDLKGRISAAMRTALDLGFDDEDALRALNDLTNGIGNAEDAIVGLALAEDIARGRGISLAQAAKIVIAAEQGRIGSLQRIGIKLGENATAEEALAALTAQYADQAERYAETNAATWDRTSNKVENSLESIGGFLTDYQTELFSAAAIASIVKIAGPSVGALASAAGGWAALGTALSTVALPAVALAAPLGILSYLVIDQSRVMADAAEQTAKNEDALRGYISYLESIGTEETAITQMSQDMKELFDWATKTSAAGFEGLIDPDDAGPIEAYVGSLGSLGDELLSLNPDNLDAVLDLTKQLSIDLTKPETWNVDSMALVIDHIATLARMEADAESQTLELNRAMGLQTITMGGLATVSGRVTNSWSDMAAANEGLSAKTQRQLELTGELADLFEGLGDVGAEGLDRAYGAIVGFTSGIVSSITTTQEWIDTLAKTNDVSAEQAIITDANARATAAANDIQAANADIIADQADAAADYIESIAAMEKGEQLLALAWADSDLSGRAQEIAEMARQYEDMGAAGKEGFEKGTLAAAAQDPMLAALLVDLGLITEKVGEPGAYDIVIPTEDAESDMDRLTDAIDHLADVIDGTPDVNVDANLDTSGFWAAHNDLPDSKVIDVWYNQRQDGGAFALGGMMPYEETAALGRVSGGNMALVGENGPEIVKLHGGDMVIPNHASRYMDQGKGGGVNFYGPVTVIANNPEQFMQQMRSYSTTMERR